MSLDTAIAQTAKLYRKAPPQHRHYVAAKLRTDPLTKELYDWLQREPRVGQLVDAGCGRGQFGLFLSQVGHVEALTAFDHDEKKVRAGALAAEGRSENSCPVDFHSGDLRTAAYDGADTILLLDVIHYLPPGDQDLVLGRCAEALSPGGRLLIRETNRGGGVGSWFAGIFEHIGRFLRINRGEKMAFRDPGDLEAVLAEQGLHVERYAPKGALQNVLLVATRAG